MTLQKFFLQNAMKKKRIKDNKIKEWNESGGSTDIIKIVREKAKITDETKKEALKLFDL